MKEGGSELPAPEVLQSHNEAKSDEPKASGPLYRDLKQKQTSKTRPRRTTYRPSHKATFIGLGVVAGVLALNAVIIMFVIRAQSPSDDAANRSEVTISSDTLDQLGVSRNPIGNLGTELTVGPDAQFNGKVVITGDTTIGGALKLNSTFTAAGGSFTDLQGGETSLTSLNVNQDTSTSNLNVRDELVVEGTARFQGAVTASQLVTINNNLNVTGSLAVGGALSVRDLRVGSLTADGTLTIGGHILTRGSAPAVSSGGAVGANGTVSISGTDAAGTVAVNVGTGGGNGTLATVTFANNYTSTPHVVVTAIGRSAGSVYVNRSAAGFSISVGNSLSTGGYAFDYIIIQ